MEIIKRNLLSYFNCKFLFKGALFSGNHRNLGFGREWDDLMYKNHHGRQHWDV